MLKKVLSRTVITALLILIQVAWIVVMLMRLSAVLPVIDYALRIVSLIAIFHVIKSDIDPSYKVSWVLCIAFLPRQAASGIP